MADYWYAHHARQQLGPMPLAKLQEIRAAGQLRPTDYVWTVGWPQWKQAREVPELLAPPAPAATPAPAGGAMEAIEVEQVLPGYRAAVQAAAAPPYGAFVAATGAVDYRRPPGPIEASTATCVALLGCRPWMLLFAILGFIGGALTVLSGGCLVIVGIAEGNRDSLFLMLMGMTYVVMGVVFLAPPLFLARGARALATLRQSRRPEDLERAAVAQLRFWRWSGLAFLSTIACYLAILVFALLFA